MERIGWILILCVMIATTMFVFACGDDDDDDSDLDDDDDNDDNQDDDDDDSGDDDDDSGDDDDDDNDDDNDDDDDTSGNDLWGSIYISEGYTSSNYTSLTYSNYAGASFYDPDEAAAWNTPEESAGDCERYFYDNPNPYDYNYLNGGTVTLTGANVTPIHLTPTAYQYGYYYTPDYDYLNCANLFDGGDTIAFSNTGSGSVPAFSGQINAPGEVTITQPSNFDSLTTAPSGAMTFAWQTSEADNVSVMVSTTKNYKTQTIICRVDDADGSVTIPQSLMEDLYSSPESTTFQILKFNSDEFSASGKYVGMTAQTYRQRTYIIVKE